MARADRRFRLGSRAFTLLEAVAALAILGGVIVGLLLSRQRALDAARSARELLTCTRLCASRLALLRAGQLAEGEGDFASPEGFSWRVETATLPDDAPEGLAAFRVSVSPPSADAASGAAATVWLRAPTDDEGTAP